MGDRFSQNVVPDGSAAVPGVAFSNDLNTGLFLKAADSLGISLAGAEAALFSSAGLTSNGLKMWMHSSTPADHGTITLPTFTLSMFGILIGKAGASYSLFVAIPDGTVTMIHNTGDVVANAATDAKIDIGVAVANPIVVTNELGAAYDINIVVWYI